MADQKITQYDEKTTPANDDWIEIVDMHDVGGNPKSKKISRANLIKSHGSAHENGGTDEIDVAGLSGLLADSQTPLDHATEHKSGGGDVINLDELGAPADNTNLNVSTGAHGLAPKLPGDSAKFLNGAGGYSIPAGTGGGDVLGPATNSDKYIPLWTGANSKELQDGIPPGNRSLIINGQGLVNQRVNAFTLIKDTYGFGPDLHMGMATGTTVNAGTFGQTLTANCGASGVGFKFAGVTLTGTGILYHRYRMEAKDAINFKNKAASFSCRAYHDKGSNVNYTIYVRKANSENNFSVVTEISNSGTPQSVPSATETAIKYENIFMGDCSNGLEFEIKIECGAITTKNFELTDLLLELSPISTNFIPRLFAEEFGTCRRYFEKSYSLATEPGSTADLNGSFTFTSRANDQLDRLFVDFKTQKFKAPTIHLYAPVSGTPNCWRAAITPGDLAALTATIGENGFCAYPGANTTSGEVYLLHWVAEANL